MNCVPIFDEMEDDGSIRMQSGFYRPRNPPAGEKDVMEIGWKNGPVVLENQNQIQAKKSAFSSEVLIQAEREIRLSEEQQHLFMQEDEMASLLQYPLLDDIYADLLYPTPPPQSLITAAVTEIRPPIQLPVTKPENPPRVQNFVHFSRLPNRQRSESTPALSTVRETTVVESNETPMIARFTHMPQMYADSGTITAGTSAAAGDLAAGTCDLNATTSSPGGSRTSFSASEETHHPQQKPAGTDRKRKAVELDDNECPSEDIEFEAALETKKRARGPALTKRTRAAEVHNQSERRRRDRINEKMRLLQELIPRCNKADKASMLDEAIEYLKSLQLQVQMMSMGCGMVPMMYPGMQQFMPPMGMGMNMGMGMGMDMNRPMVPYPSMVPGPGAHMAGPRFPMSQFHHMQPVPVPNPCGNQTPNQTNHPPNSVVSHNQYQPQMTNFVDPYHQQFLGLQHPQSKLPLAQNHTVQQPGSTKPTSKGTGNPDHNQQKR